MRYERRFTLAGNRKVTSQRASTESDGKVVRGYAAVFYDEANPDGTQFDLYYDVVERIMPGAFDRALKEAHDARGLFNHDPNWLLGRVSSGTVRLSIDSIGLKYEIDQNDADPQWQSVAAKIDRGDITGSSFGFVVRSASWLESKDKDKKIWYRQIEDVDLYDVSPVTWPAYTGTSAGRMVSDDDRRALEAERAAQFADADRMAINARLASMGMPLLT